ncbi:MAG: ABC transporter ATP-binding protein [Geminicoccaceae bacterium]
MNLGRAKPAIEIRKVVKRYGAVPALKGVTLDIRDNEFFTLLGPSGCGKTTLLRLIAGFEEVTDGTILLFGQEIADLPPNKRPVNTVFQHYALFPHMTVAENVAFGMRRLKTPKTEVMERTGKVLELVKLEALADRRPSQLSGGQQQRVALARAMAPRPKVLLLDEPLSALDLKLRQAMRVELKQLQQETGITFVFVTHDQEEALTMSDRIAVMSEGEIQQVGTAHEIYEKPDNRFVADFIGETNLLDVTIAATDNASATDSASAAGSSYACQLPGGAVIEAEAAGSHAVGEAGHVSIRPERISISRPQVEGAGPAGQVEHVVYLGTDTQHLVRLDDGSLITVRTQNAHRGFVDLKLGDRATLTIDPGAARLLVD